MARDKAADQVWSKRHARLVQAKKDLAYLSDGLSDSEHATTAARFLARLQATEAVGPIVRALDSPDQGLHIAAIRAL